MNKGKALNALPRRTLPFEPIYRLAVALCANDIDPTAAEVGNVLGVGHSAVSRWLSAGVLRVTTADKLCVRGLGLHPAAVYGDAFWVGTCLDPAHVERHELAGTTLDRVLADRHAGAAA